MQRAQRQREVTSFLSRSQASRSGDLQAFVRDLTDLAAKAMGCERVNLSALQFKKPRELEGDIAGALAECQLSPSMLEVELTETVFMDASRERTFVGWLSNFVDNRALELEC